jgi:hypothetical protein
MYLGIIARDVRVLGDLVGFKKCFFGDSQGFFCGGGGGGSSVYMNLRIQKELHLPGNIFL